MKASCGSQPARDKKRRDGIKREQEHDRVGVNWEYSLRSDLFKGVL